MLKRRTRANLKLEVGITFLLILVAVAVAGPYLAPYGLDETWTSYYVDMPDGTRAMKTAPEPPSAAHWFGTNKWGYDLLTLMLHGARYTIFIAVVVAGLRVATGTAIGTVLGLRSGRSGDSARGPILPGLPVLIVLIFILHPISVNSTLTIVRLFTIHCAFLTIPGVPGVAAAMRSRVAAISESPMVESGVVAGAATVAQHDP